MYEVHAHMEVYFLVYLLPRIILHMFLHLILKGPTAFEYQIRRVNFLVLKNSIIGLHLEIHLADAEEVCIEQNIVLRIGTTLRLMLEKQAKRKTTRLLRVQGIIPYPWI